MNISEEIGNRIRYQRKKRNLSQEELAEMSDLSTSFIGQLERGSKQPTIDSLYKITNSFGMSLSDFLRDIDYVYKDEDSYGIKSYVLIEQVHLSDQRHIYEIVKHITDMLIY